MRYDVLDVIQSPSVRSGQLAFRVRAFQSVGKHRKQTESILRVTAQELIYHSEGSCKLGFASVLSYVCKYPQYA
jgi:hypothetical protein